MPKQSIGRFEIIRELGKGGQGIVYLAKGAQLDRQVAIKTLRNLAHKSEPRARGANCRQAAIPEHHHAARCGRVPGRAISGLCLHGVMVARSSFGAGISEIIPQFRFPLAFVADVFHLCIQKGVDIAIENVHAPNGHGISLSRAAICHARWVNQIAR